MIHKAMRSTRTPKPPLGRRTEMPRAPHTTISPATYILMSSLIISMAWQCQVQARTKHTVQLSVRELGISPQTITAASPTQLLPRPVVLIFTVSGLPTGKTINNLRNDSRRATERLAPARHGGNTRATPRRCSRRPMPCSKGASPPATGRRSIDLGQDGGIRCSLDPVRTQSGVDGNSALLQYVNCRVLRRDDWLRWRESCSVQLILYFYIIMYLSFVFYSPTTIVACPSAPQGLVCWGCLDKLAKSSQLGAGFSILLVTFTTNVQE